MRRGRVELEDIHVFLKQGVLHMTSFCNSYYSRFFVKCHFSNWGHRLWPRCNDAKHVNQVRHFAKGPGINRGFKAWWDSAFESSANQRAGPGKWAAPSLRLSSLLHRNLDSRVYEKCFCLAYKQFAKVTTQIVLCFSTSKVDILIIH